MEDVRTYYKGLYHRVVKMDTQITQTKPVLNLPRITCKVDHMPTETVTLGEAVGKRNVSGWLTFIFYVKQSIVRKELRK